MWNHHKLEEQSKDFHRYLLLNIIEVVLKNLLHNKLFKVLQVYIVFKQF